MKSLLRLFSCVLCVLLLGGAAGAETTFAFEGHFLPAGSAPIRTDTEYRSENVHILFRDGYNEDLKTDIHVAEVYVRTLDCFQHVYAHNAAGKKASTLRRMNERVEAILLMNGDNGIVDKHGLAARSKMRNSRELCLITNTGEMQVLTYAQAKAQGLYENHDFVKHSFCFGPSLMTKDGEPITKKEDFSTTNVYVKNPRTVLGYYEPGHYALVVVAGRGTKSQFKERSVNRGLDLSELSVYMHSLGCKQAYNLDGGQTSAMMTNGEYRNALYKNGRAVTDAIIICEPGANYQP